MVLAERCTSGDLFIEALTQNHIPLVFMEDVTEENRADIITDGIGDLIPHV